MNLAGNQAKQLFKALRTGGRPPTVALWAAASAIDQIRKRERPAKELLVSKTLKPGESYVIRVPGEGEESLAAGVARDASVSVTSTDEGSITSQLFDAATDLLSAAHEPEPEEPEPIPEPSRRSRRRATRVAALDDFDIDRDSLPRRRRRKLQAAEKRAQKRPSRRRMRKARRQQKRASAAVATLERKARPSRRMQRRRQAAEREVEYRAAKVERRSTRRRRRKLRRAEKARDRL